SRVNRSRNLLSSAYSGFTSLIAASLPLGSSPKNTVPMPPRPNRPSKAKGPIWRGSFAVSGFTARPSRQGDRYVGVARLVFYCDRIDFIDSEAGRRAAGRSTLIRHPSEDLVAGAVAADHDQSHSTARGNAGHLGGDPAAGALRGHRDGQASAGAPVDC